MTTLRPDLPPLPRRFHKLPLDDRGFPVPYFVGWTGEGDERRPVFQAMDPEKWATCVKRDTCWLCGEALGSIRACMIGPMCIINRTTQEPPSHIDCAEFAALACPFMTRPLAQRNERNLPEGHAPAAGLGLKRNPGVTAMWVMRRKGYRVKRIEAEPEHGVSAGYLLALDEPVEVKWFARGRKATRSEVIASIESGLPLLLGVEAGNPEAVAEVSRRYDDAKRFLPSEDDPHPYVLSYAPDWRSTINDADRQVDSRPAS